MGMPAVVGDGRPAVVPRTFAAVSSVVETRFVVVDSITFSISYKFDSAPGAVGIHLDPWVNTFGVWVFACSWEITVVVILGTITAVPTIVGTCLVVVLVVTDAVSKAFAGCAVLKMSTTGQKAAQEEKA